MEVYLFNFNTCQDLELIEIGNQQCAPMYSFGPYIRNEYIFHYIVSGKGKVMLNPSSGEKQNILSETIEVKAGEGFLLEPQTKHMYIADEKDPWHYIWIVFTGLSVPSYLRASGLTRNNPIFRPESYQRNVSVQIMEPLRQILRRHDASKAFIIGQLHLFFNELIEHTSVPEKIAASDISIANIYIAEAIRYIESRYATIRSLDEVADFCNVTRSHLARLFKNSLHVTLQEYLINYRLNKSMELLINTDLPIYQIAQQVGYEGALQFNKAFKNRMKIPPKTWRLQNRARLSGSPNQ